MRGILFTILLLVSVALVPVSPAAHCTPGGNTTPAVPVPVGEDTFYISLSTDGGRVYQETNGKAGLQKENDICHGQPSHWDQRIGV